MSNLNSADIDERTLEPSQRPSIESPDEKKIAEETDVSIVDGKFLSNQTSFAELGSEPAPPARTRYWLDNVETKRADFILLACCVVTGLLDTSTFRNWAVFVSMQTGNTVILCLSTAGFPEGQPYAFAATLISLGAFFLGAFVTTRLSLLFGPKRRLILSFNFILQALFIVLGAALATSEVLLNDQHSTPEIVLRDPRVLIGIGPLAFQSGATIATSRLLGFGNEIPATVYTSTYAALAADPKLFHLGSNPPRDRRLAAVLALFIGAFIATWLERRSIGMIATFWMSAGIKFLLAASVAFLLPRKQEAPKS